VAPQALDDVPLTDATARPAEPTPVRRRRRRPNLAASLSVIPGGGQLYNGQPKKAAVFLVCTLATIGPAILLITAGERIGTNLLNSHRFTLFLLVAFASIVVFLGLFLLGLAFWASSVVDARRSAEELNAGMHDPGAGRWWFFRL
jgi:arabinogalactan oligomer / maltooligosaccharide transport system permease protein